MRMEIKCQINDLLRQISQLFNRVRQRGQLVVADWKTIKESDENWNQSSYWMPYAFRLVNNPIDSGREVSLLLWRQSLEEEGENDENPASESTLVRLYSHVVHDWASCDASAISRSSPDGFHCPEPKFSVDMRSLRALKKNVSKAWEEAIECMG